MKLSLRYLYYIGVILRRFKRFYIRCRVVVHIKVESVLYSVFVALSLIYQLINLFCFSLSMFDKSEVFTEFIHSSHTTLNPFRFEEFKVMSVRDVRVIDVFYFTAYTAFFSPV